MEGLSRLIDHAALFPPASMDMPAAVAEDARARRSEEAWMLARFVCPASRLRELERQLGDAEPPAVSAVLDGGDWATSALPVEAVEMVGPPDFEPTGVELCCGGRSVPSVEDVAAFFAAARDLELPFKATAGLHHPVRSEREHGFLNFLTAADRAAAGADEAELRHVLGATDPAELGTGSAAGRRLFVSIGSCSFAEPVEDLRRLGLL